MTNLSTSEVLEKLAPEFVALDGVRPGQYRMERDLMDTQTRALLDTLAQTLLKLERAKEALRFYASGEDVIFCSVIDGLIYEQNYAPDSESDNPVGQKARAALAYIEEGKE